MRRKTDVEFKKEVYDLVGNEYTFLDDYQGALTKIRVKHNKCGHTYRVDPSHFLRGSRCNYCYVKIQRKTNSQFKKEVYDLVGNEYTFLDYYATAKTKIRVKHNKCGHIYRVDPNSFLQGRRCQYCHSNAKKTNVEFRKEVYNLVGDEYTFLDPYVNANTKIKVKHNKCNNIYGVKPGNFLHGSRCPYCAGYINKTDDQFKEEVYNLVGDEYTFLDPYVNSETKIRVKHNKCGNVYSVRPSDFISHRTRCPYCNSPKGELIITKILDRLSIFYESQKTFDDLKDIAYLSYDFYIPDQNTLIEYQGIQHYQPIEYFGGESQFKIQQKHDKLKADYAKAHNYNLITVPYTKDTFSKIKKYLLQHGLAK